MKRVLFAILLACAAIPGIAQDQESMTGREASPLCQTVSDLDRWLVGAKSFPAANYNPKAWEETAAVYRELLRLCLIEDNAYSDDARLRVPWFIHADVASERLGAVLSTILTSPQTTASRKGVQSLARLSAQVQSAIGSRRSPVYKIVEVRVETTTIEVPGKCPQCPVPACPEPQSHCDSSLRAGAQQWATALYQYTNAYTCDGCTGWRFAKDTAPVLRVLTFGGNTDDPVDVVVGWLAQYREVRRNRGDGVDVDERVARVAADMRARLALCGRPQSDGDHGR